MPIALAMIAHGGKPPIKQAVPEGKPMVVKAKKIKTKAKRPKTS
jgi:hypothetical protein